MPNTELFDVILFRESLYHVPMGKMIVRLKTLTPTGQAKTRPTATIRLVEDNFEVVEEADYKEAGSTGIVFRPRRR